MPEDNKDGFKVGQLHDRWGIALVGSVKALCDKLSDGAEYKRPEFINQGVAAFDHLKLKIMHALDKADIFKGGKF